MVLNAGNFAPPKVEQFPAVDRQLSKAGAEHEQQKPTFTLKEASSTTCRHPPLSELWDIDPSLSEPDLLRDEIRRLAREIAHEADAASSIESIDDGIGFVCHCHSTSSAAPPADALQVRAVHDLLAALSAAYVPGRSGIDGCPLADELAPLLQGTFAGHGASSPRRLSDGAILKLFRLIRLARRLVDIQATALSCADLPHSPR